MKNDKWQIKDHVQNIYFAFKDKIAKTFWDG